MHAPLTEWLAHHVATLDVEAISGDASLLAGQCVLDWIGVTVKAADERQSLILADTLDEIGGSGSFTVVGSDRQRPLRDAVLLNGATGHVLDYDDVHRLTGHPSVPIVPGALGVGEAVGASGRDLLLAIVAGFEASCRVGAYLGDASYAVGWHTTGTAGVFGATAAAAKLYGLDEAALRHAFGIAGTQSAGLKAVFGTMTKPLHAGLAAQAGLLAATLAGRGFTSSPNILENPQGNGRTQSPNPDAACALADPPGGFHILQTHFKYHAACYLTHSAIEAAAALKRAQPLRREAVASITVDVDPGHFSVCNIQTPATGLEMKFSLRMAVALVLAGENTADDALYRDDVAQRADLRAWCNLIEVRPLAEGTETRVAVTMHDGSRRSATADIALPEDIHARWPRIERKARALAAPALGDERVSRIVAICRDLPALGDVRDLMEMLRR